MKNKLFLMFGIVAPLVYLAHIIIGSILWKEYSNVLQPISDLTATNAPNQHLLTIYTTLFNLFTLIFSISAFIYLKKLNIRLINISMLIFILLSIVSVLFIFFPEDMINTTLTYRGLIHYILTGLVVPTAILTPLLLGIGIRKINNLKSFSIYSIMTSIIIFISGFSSVLVMNCKIPIFGVIERINIGSLEIWVFLFACLLISLDLKKLNIKK